jgi:hypothetical protein
MFFLHLDAEARRRTAIFRKSTPHFTSVWVNRKRGALWGGLDERTSGDVFVQMLNDFTLSRNNLPHEIADRHDADDLPALNHGQVAYSPDSHGSQALLDRLIRRH